MSLYNLKNASLKDFILFLFDRPAPPLLFNLETPRWHGEGDEIYFDATHNAELFIELFSNSRTFLNAFTSEQLEQGFWAIQSGVLPGSLPELIWGTDIATCTKFDLLRSIYELYREFFSRDDLGTSCNMLFSSVIGRHWYGRTSRVPFGECIIQQQMFSTLLLVLSLESEACQGAALLGLTQLKHPLTKELILSFLEAHPDYSADEVDEFMTAIG